MPFVIYVESLIELPLIILVFEFHQDFSQVKILVFLRNIKSYSVFPSDS